MARRVHCIMSVKTFLVSISTPEQLWFWVESNLSKDKNLGFVWKSVAVFAFLPLVWHMFRLGDPDHATLFRVLRKWRFGKRVNTA